MKISTKGRYGLRLMVDLTTYSKDKPISLKEIASRQNISEKYLEQIVNQLNKAGLVKSVRGAQGGYILARPANEITAGDVIRVTEGSLSLVDCVDDNELCDNFSNCPTAYLWNKLKTAIEDVVDHISLQDLSEIAIRQSSDNII